MSKKNYPVFIDFDILNFDKPQEQRVMDNQCLVVSFGTKKITIKVDQHDSEKLQITKQSTIGLDTIVIEPNVSNSILIS